MYDSAVVSSLVRSYFVLFVEDDDLQALALTDEL
jgi:hypothetical protein